MVVTGSYRVKLGCLGSSSRFRPRRLRQAAAERRLRTTLRCSFVSEGVPAGVPLEVVADLAGHKDVETTDRVYRARRDDVQIAASEALGRHLRELTTGSVSAVE